MTQKEIYALLLELFGTKVHEWTEVQAGDSWVSIEKEALPDIALFLRDDYRCKFNFLRLITGIDRGEKLSSVYHLYSYIHHHALTLRVDVPRDDPVLPSVTAVWPAADWLERETYDMTGLIYQGHPELLRILLPLDWQGYPLRKDYRQPAEYHGVRHD